MCSPLSNPTNSHLRFSNFSVGHFPTINKVFVSDSIRTNSVSKCEFHTKCFPVSWICVQGDSKVYLPAVFFSLTYWIHWNGRDRNGLNKNIHWKPNQLKWYVSGKKGGSFRQLAADENCQGKNLLSFLFVNPISSLNYIIILIKKSRSRRVFSEG